MKTNLAKVFNDCKSLASKHSPELLTGIGIAGMITTTILAVKATPKVLQLIDERKEELKVDKLPKTEVLKVVWKPYIPSAITGILSVSCVIGATTVNFRRNAALATAYKLSEEALSTYKAKVIETIGEKKELAIREKIDQDKIDNNPVSKNTVIITEAGNTLCYDGVSGRYFRSDVETIRRALNTINREMNYNIYVSLSEFYDEIGLEHTDVSDYLGWNLDDGLVDIRFGSRLADDGTPCVVLDYHIVPKYDFDKLM